MSGQLVKIDDAQDRLMGEQLTAAVGDAEDSTIRIIRAGAMVMGVRAHLERVHDGHVRTGGTKSKGTGIKAWLEKYAPKVNRSSAYRFEDVAKAVAQQFELPARVSKQLTFDQLVTADPKALDPAARKAQEALEGFVSGTSQKSWMDRFKEEPDRGGDTSKRRKSKTKKLSAEEVVHQEAQTFFLPLQKAIFELTHNKKAVARLSNLPLTAPAAEASLNKLGSLVDSLAGMINDAKEARKK